MFPSLPLKLSWRIWAKSTVYDKNRNTTKCRPCANSSWHYSDVIMGDMASQITSMSSVFSVVCSAAHQRKHQSSALLAFVRAVHRSPVNSPHKGPVTRKMLPFDCVIMHNTMSRHIVRLNIKSILNSEYHDYGCSVNCGCARIHLSQSKTGIYHVCLLYWVRLWLCYQFLVPPRALSIPTKL